jgi:hypothetical protein
MSMEAAWRQGCTVYSCTIFLPLCLSYRNEHGSHVETGVHCVQLYNLLPPCLSYRTFTYVNLTELNMEATWRQGCTVTSCTTFYLHVYLTELNMEATWRQGCTVYSCTTFYLHVYLTELLPINVNLTELNMEATWRLGVLLCSVVIFHLSNGQTRCFPFVGMLTHTPKTFFEKSNQFF